MRPMFVFVEDYVEALEQSEQKYEGTGLKNEWSGDQNFVLPKTET